MKLILDAADLGCDHRGPEDPFFRFVFSNGVDQIHFFFSRHFQACDTDMEFCRYGDRTLRLGGVALGIVFPQKFCLHLTDAGAAAIGFKALSVTLVDRSTAFWYFREQIRWWFTDHRRVSVW